LRIINLKGRKQIQLVILVKFDVVQGIKSVKNDIMVVGVFQEGLARDAKTVDDMIGKPVSKMLQTKEFKPDFGQMKILRSSSNVLVVGLGKKSEFNLDKLRKISALVAKVVHSERLSVFYTTLQNVETNDSLKARAQCVVEGTALGLYKFDKYKTKEPDEINIERVFLVADAPAEVKSGIETGIIVSDAVNYVRNISNEPASFMTPTGLAKESQKIAVECKLKIKVYDKKDIEKMGMGGLLGVSYGSAQEPKLIVLEHNAGKKKVCIVGKGVTFDSGGLDIKPADYMTDMKTDMAGAAAVLGIMKIVSKLKLPITVIGVMPATENMPGCAAYKPGDILTSHNKKTIEIINTDAEGRLILADALSFAEKTYSPDAIIDLATLTGACIVALGYTTAGILGADEKLIKKVYDAGIKSSEKVWQLPFWDEYKENVKSDVADLRNASKGGLSPGTINGAMFLSNFVEKTPWVHIDMAGPACMPDEKEYTPKGATGFGVRLITQMLIDWQ
jgi:leucyl aminopeptidase